MRKALEGFISPKFGFTKFAQFNQHAHLAGPGTGIRRIELKNLGIEAQTRLELAALERSTSFRDVISFVLGQRTFAVFFRLTAEFEVNKPAHNLNWRRHSQRSQGFPRN